MIEITEAYDGYAFGGDKTSLSMFYWVGFYPIDAFRGTGFRFVRFKKPNEA